MGEVCGCGAKKVRAGRVGEIMFVRCLFGCGKVGGIVEKITGNILTCIDLYAIMEL